MYPITSSLKSLICLGMAAVLWTGCARKPEEKEASFLEDGRKHFAAKDFARAAIDFRNAAQAMPKDAEPHYQLGLAYLESGNSKLGINELLQATRLDPKHVTAQLKLAQLMIVNGNSEVVKAGQKRAEEVLATSPDNPDVLQALAFSELRLNDSADAIQHLEQALKKVPQHLNSATTLALAKLANRDVAGAELVMQKAVADAPRSVEHAVAFGSFYAYIRKPADAEKQFRRALEIDPKYGPALTAMAAWLYGSGKLDEAGQLFQRAAALPDKQYRPLHAIFLLNTGKGDQAIAEFAQQFKEDPQNREARTRLVSAYVRLGRIPDAVRILTEALKGNAKDSDALMQRGELSLAAGKFQDAQTDLTEVLQSKPDSAEAHLVMGRIHRARHATASEVHELTEALRLNPRLMPARLELAYRFTEGNSPKSAIELLAQASPSEQQDLTLIVYRNAALYALGDFAQVRKGIDQGLAISRHPTLLLQDGLLRLKDKDYKGSRVPLEEALKLSPQDWRAVNALGLSYLGERKNPEATAIVQQYTSRVPDSAEAQQFLGTWLSRTGDLTGASAAFRKAKSLNPNSTAADFGLARIALTEGKVDAARDHFAGILNREPRNVIALLNLGGVEVRAARPFEAMGYYERALQEDSSNIEALNNLGYLLADTRKDPDRALTLARKAKELAPGDSAVDDTIGWAYYNKGMFQASLDYLSKAANGGSPQRKCHLAMAYIKLGDRQRALTTLQAVLKEDPSLPEAQKALQSLSQAR